MSQQQNAAPNPLVTFKGNLKALVDRKELALPSNVSVDAFMNAAIVAAQDNAKILACDQQSVFKSLRTLAAAGLVPDGREAALVPFRTKDGDRYVDKCQAMPMVFGLIKMVRRSGEVSDIRAHIVYQKEIDDGRFEYVVGDRESLRHEPILFGAKGDPVAAYAIAMLKDGAIVREFMSAEEIDTVRRSGASQKIFKKGESPRISEEPIGIWKDWWAEMWKKTVIRRICKRLDMSSEDMRRVMAEPDLEGIRDVTPREQRDSAFTRLANRARGKEEAGVTEAHDGEVLPPEEKVSFALLDTADAFPGSDEFTDGAKAGAAGASIEDCPHAYGSQKAIDWCGGFFGARESVE